MTHRLPTVEELTFLYVLDSIKGFGPKKFKLCFEAKLSAKQVVDDPATLPISGKLGDPLRQQLKDQRTRLMEECKARAEKQLSTADNLNASILTYGHPHYPTRVYASNNAVPVLYCRGNTELLSSSLTVSCVGSRKIRSPYSELQVDFARAAVKSSFTVVSGFALGADTIAHRAAIEANGRTIAVMPSGLDRPFPPENKAIWNAFLANPSALFVSEFPFGSGANSLNLRKRNKLIVALAGGVLIAQSATDGGAMNAYRFAIEQKKPLATFRSDNAMDTSGNLLVGESQKYPAQIFEIHSDDADQYQQWLRKLSF